MRALDKMGYKLYASLGTADFYTEHGVNVSVLFFAFFSAEIDFVGTHYLIDLMLCSVAVSCLLEQLKPTILLSEESVTLIMLMNE